ncbi:prealbumin-like fold domain-containing protein [Bacillus thuringiensis]
MKKTLCFLSLLVLIGMIVFSSDMFTINVQAASKQSILAKDVSNEETRILEINLRVLEWKYSSEYCGHIEFYPERGLENVEFTIYKDGKVYGKQQTNTNGEIYFHLPTGIYTYKQTSKYPATTVANYLPDPTMFSVTISPNKLSYQHIIYNKYSRFFS